MYKYLHWQPPANIYSTEVFILWIWPQVQSCWFCEELAYGVTDTECATHRDLVHDNTDTDCQSPNSNSHSHVFMSFKRQLSQPCFYKFQTATLTAMFSEHSKPLLQSKNDHQSVCITVLWPGPMMQLQLGSPLKGYLEEQVGGGRVKTDQHGRSTEDVGERVVDEVHEGRSVQVSVAHHLTCKKGLASPWNTLSGISPKVWQPPHTQSIISSTIWQPSQTEYILSPKSGNPLTQSIISPKVWWPPQTQSIISPTVWRPSQSIISPKVWQSPQTQEYN